MYKLFVSALPNLTLSNKHFPVKLNALETHSCWAAACQSLYMFPGLLEGSPSLKMLLSACLTAA